MILLILLCGIGIILYYYIPRQYRRIEMAKATIKYYLRRFNVTIENTQWYQRITFTLIMVIFIILLYLIHENYYQRCQEDVYI